MGGYFFIQMTDYIRMVNEKGRGRRRRKGEVMDVSLTLRRLCSSSSSSFASSSWSHTCIDLSVFF